jgi:hypothetical protein
VPSGRPTDDNPHAAGRRVASGAGSPNLETKPGLGSGVPTVALTGLGARTQRTRTLGPDARKRGKHGLEAVRDMQAEPWREPLCRVQGPGLQQGESSPWESAPPLSLSSRELLLVDA